MVDAFAPKPMQRAATKDARKTRHWPRVPMSLVVAVLGIALSSWLIPAFTRQWDDRQRAGELKATVVADMATATGRALMAAQAASAVPPSDRASSAASPAAGQEWSVAALQIRARLDAYFGSTAVDRWALVTQYVNSTLSVAYRSSTGALAVIPGSRLAPTSSPRLATLYRRYLTGDGVIDGLAVAILEEEQAAARHILDMHVRGYSTTWRDVGRDLFPMI